MSFGARSWNRYLSPCAKRKLSRPWRRREEEEGEEEEEEEEEKGL